MKLEHDMINLKYESYEWEPRQDKYIRDIIDYSETLESRQLFQKLVWAQLLTKRYYNRSQRFKKIKITTDLEIDKINSDELKLKLL
jgi:hypothetical protein